MSFFTLSDLGLPSSQAQLMTLWLDAMQTQFPDYNPAAGDLEYIQAQVIGSWASDVAQLCSQGSFELFRQFGLQLLNLPIELGVPSQTVISVTAQDTAGYTLPFGTQLTLNLGGVDVAFQTAQTLTIAPGSSSGQVVVIASQNGTAFNGAGNPAALVSQVNWVTGISALASSQGGVDQEDDNAYVQRLANTLQLLAPRPITASDYSTMAINFIPTAGTDQQEVGRATTIDGYDPSTNTYNNEREVTVCVTDANGSALNSDTLTAVQTYLKGLREQNFIVNVVSPNYTAVYVAVTVAGVTGVPSATVQANVQTSLLNYLSPANFGLPINASVGWQNTVFVYRSRIEALIQDAPGVDHIVDGTLAIDTNSTPTQTSGDLALSGPFPLPTANVSTIPLTAITVQ